ncbi:hypothetical protein PR048_006201 [Dryococelus australis]|uniref:Uncharacterized protein n=1 Tax=Dryococelus australis TaxID=614101 RepID=A0ABQ9IB99_9NEOP|nr:hypothetical protein PR048_006201 [Dryococelus australis]
MELAKQRRTSSSSATSSVANVGSPKPEKRQANSPLPPPPAGSPELHGSMDQKSNSRLEVGIAKNVEEMYAKVVKKKQRGVLSEGEPVSDESFTSGIPQPRQERLSVGSADQKVDSMSCASVDSRDSEYRSLQDTKQVDTDSTSSSDHNLSQDSRLVFELNVPHNGLSSSSHEALYSSSGSPPHTFAEPGYESLGQPHSILYSDPGYERVCRQPSESDPNYEELHPCNEQTCINCEEPGYISITEQKLNFTDPNHLGDANVASGEFYDCVGSSLFPGYERVRPQLNSELEPDYASLGKKRYSGPFRLNDDGNDDSGDPNYESVSSETQEPNYEMLNHEDPNYESVNYSVNVLTDEPPYERLNNEARDSDNDTSVAEYERMYASSVDVAHKQDRVAMEDQGSDTSDYTKCAEPGYEVVVKSKMISVLAPLLQEIQSLPCLAV